MAALMKLAESANLKTASIRAALTQFITKIRHGSDGSQTLFNVRCMSHRRAARVLQDIPRACDDTEAQRMQILPL